MLLDSRCEDFLEIVYFLISIPLPPEYRLLVVSHTDWFWLVIPMGFGHEYRFLLVSFTDWFWLVIPTGFGHEYRFLLVSFTDWFWLEIPTPFGQFYRLFMVSCIGKFPAKRSKLAMRGGVALSVCLFV